MEAIVQPAAPLYVCIRMIARRLNLHSIRWLSGGCLSIRATDPFLARQQQRHHVNGDERYEDGKGEAATTTTCLISVMFASHKSVVGVDS